MAAPNFDAQDIQQNKALGGLGYLLFFVPLLACPNSKYGRYCANQGLLFWIVLIGLQLAFGVIGWVFGWVPILNWVLYSIGRLAMGLVLLLELYYTISAMSSGAAKEVPVIGEMQIIK